jgi:hypothetical protein
MQQTLRWADWGFDGIRDDMLNYVVEHPGQSDGANPHDTGLLKKTRSAGRSDSTRALTGLSALGDLGKP